MRCDIVLRTCKMPSFLLGEVRLGSAIRNRRCNPLNPFADSVAISEL